MSFDFVAWNMESKGQEPLRSLANLAHLCPEHDMARCQVVAALLLSAWQLTGRAFSETAPSFMLVNCSSDSDSVWRALHDMLKRCMEVPERASEQDTIISSDPHRGNPALCRRTMLAFMARLRTLRASDAHPALVEAEIRKSRPDWVRIKAEAFPNPALLLLGEAWDDDFGLISHDDECISLLIPDSKNRETLRKVLDTNPKLYSMDGVGGSIEFVPKRVALMGVVPATEWNARLTRDLLESSLPVLFLPCDSPTTIHVPELGLLRSLVLRFTRHFRFSVPPAHADPSLVEVDDEALKYLNLIHGLTKGISGDVAFRIQFLLRQLYSVVNILTLMTVPGHANPATASCEPGQVARDLYVTALRGVAYGAAALRFHCIGIPSLENDPHAAAVLAYLRGVDRPVLRRDIQRKVYTLTAKERDELITRLDEVGLVSVEGKLLEAVRLSDYLSGVPEREKFPPVTLLTRERRQVKEAGKSSVA